MNAQINPTQPQYVSATEFDCGEPAIFWIAIRVATGREFTCEQILRDDGKATFLPLLHYVGRVSRDRKRKTLHARPLMRGYLFVGFNGFPSDVELSDVLRFRFVQSVVGHNDRPIAISQRDMHRVLGMAQRPIHLRRTRKSKNRALGFAGNIGSGPYAGKPVRYSSPTGSVAVDIFETFQQPIAHHGAP